MRRGVWNFEILYRFCKILILIYIWFVYVVEERDLGLGGESVVVFNCLELKGCWVILLGEGYVFCRYINFMF